MNGKHRKFVVGVHLLVAEIRLTLILLTIDAQVLIETLVSGIVDISCAVAGASQVVDASRFVSCIS